MSRTKVTRLIALPAVLLALAGVAAATTGLKAQTGGSPAAQVRAAERTVLGAYVDADTHTLGGLLARDYQQIDVTGTAETRADTLANVGGGVDFVTLKPVSPIAVRVHGDSAVARVELAFKVVASGQTVQHRGWNTDLFERRHGHWQLVWTQTTAIPNNLGLFIQSLM
jgi:Domain of unknown function (DUF4440)